MSESRPNKAVTDEELIGVLTAISVSHCFITMHIHDELDIEGSPGVDLKVLCEQMGRTPPWADGLKLRADGYETMFYKKD